MWGYLQRNFEILALFFPLKYFSLSHALKNVARENFAIVPLIGVQFWYQVWITPTKCVLYGWFKETVNYKFITALVVYVPLRKLWDISFFHWQWDILIFNNIGVQLSSWQMSLKYQNTWKREKIHFLMYFFILSCILIF